MSTPEYTYTTVNGVRFLTLEEWDLNDKLHRIDGPARREWEVVDGRAVLIAEDWYLNDRHHRTDGPAWRDWNVFNGSAVLTHESWWLKGIRIHPRILRQPVRVIERWWQYQRHRRQQAIEESLWDSGMTVFPGFMGLLKEC
jgi:hypothetical protein